LSAGVLPRTLLGELTALLQTHWLDLREPFRGRERKGDEGSGWRGKGIRSEEKEVGRKGEVGRKPRCGNEKGEVKRRGEEEGEMGKRGGEGNLMHLCFAILRAL